MRRFSICLLAMTLAWAAPVFAGSGEGKGIPTAKKDSKPAETTASKATPAKTKNDSTNAAAAKPANAAAVAEELDQLKAVIEQQAQELETQRKQIEVLQQQMSVASAGATLPARLSPEAPAATPAPATSAAASVATPTVESSDIATPSAAPAREPRVSTATLNSGAAASLPEPSSAGAQSEPKLGPLAFQKIKLGVTMFGDYAFYTDTGFGPQFLTQINQPGPGNAHFNSFDITRAYLNFFYMPNDKITIRITPNVYRQVDGSSGTIGNGSGATIGGSTNGNLTFRLKYAYVQFNKLFAGSSAFGKDHIVFGSETNPLVDWEESLYGYRYTSLVPWNYISLSSTYDGGKIEGPIEFHGREYLDYSLGVYDTASFHAIEQNDKKQLMARLTWYPLGTKKDRTGLLITAFENYGYNTKTPDTKSTPLNRGALIVSYQTPSQSAQIAGEYDFGRNAMSTGNLYSGAGPASGSVYFDPGYLGTVANTVLAGDRTRQQGFAFFGHVKLGHSPFALFGLYQYFQPNTNFDAAAAGYTSGDPIDWERVVGGISYAYDSHLDMALQDSHFQFVHPQGTLGTNNTNAIMLAVQFNY